MRVKTWKILDYGEVAPDAATAPVVCLKCGHEAVMPVRGRPLAQVGQGLVFDTESRGALPPVVQCRKCRRIYTAAEE